MSETIAEEVLLGAKKIGKFTGLTERQVYHAAERGYLPIGKFGDTLIARKPELNRAMSPSAKASETA